MQVDPIISTLKAPGTKRLKLEYDKPLSKIGFNCNFRRYKEDQTAYPAAVLDREPGRGLHSFTSQLNLSRFGHTCPCSPV